MRREFAPGAKVFVAAHEGSGEQSAPDAVHKDASREGVLRMHQPAGEIEPGGWATRGRRERREHRGGRRGDWFARPEEVSLQQHMGGAGGRRLGQCRDHRLVIGRERGGEVDFFGIVEEGEQAVVLVKGEGVVLVRVALGTPHGESQPDGGGGVDPIDHGGDPELLGIDAPLFVREGLSMKARRRPLGECRVGQQVARQLFQRELIEGEVVVQGGDHPVAIPPGPGPGTIFFVSIAVGIAGLVEPVPGPALAKVGRCQQFFDVQFVGVGSGVGDQGGDPVGVGRQAGQIEGDTAGQRGEGGGLSGSELGRLQLGEDEPIDQVTGPRGLADLRRNRPEHRLEGPVAGGAGGGGGDRPGPPLRPLVDPGAEQGDLFHWQRISLGGHQDVGVESADVFHKETLGGLPGLERLARVSTPQGVSFTVEPEPGDLLLGPVTRQAMPGEQRADFAVKVDRARECRGKLPLLRRQPFNRAQHGDAEADHSDPAPQATWVCVAAERVGSEHAVRGCSWNARRVAARHLARGGETAGRQESVCGERHAKTPGKQRT